jgi:hypothetical protein
MLTRLCLFLICGAVMTYSWAQNGSNSGSVGLIALQVAKHIVIRSLQVIPARGCYLLFCPSRLRAGPSCWLYVHPYCTSYTSQYWVVSLDEPILTILTIRYARGRMRESLKACREYCVFENWVSCFLGSVLPMCFFLEFAIPAVVNRIGVDSIIVSKAPMHA